MAFRRSLRKYFANSAGPLSAVGLGFEVSPFDPHLYFLFRKSGWAVGAIATQIGNTLGSGKPDRSSKARRFSERLLGKLKVQEKPFVRAGVALARENDSSATLTREAFAKNLKYLSKFPRL